MAAKQRNLGDVLQEFRQHRQIMQQELQKVIVGQNEVIEQLFAAIFTRGHCLLEGVPGLAKTLTVNALADVLKLDFQRIQSADGKPLVHSSAYYTLNEIPTRQSDR